MQASEVDWSSTEREIAQKALDTAFHREADTIVTLVREKSSEISCLDDLWKLHDFLSARRHDIDGKYDDSQSMFVFVFARLIKEGWLTIEELEGLDGAKVSKVKLMTRM
jgi:Photoprotection regulator fluorescence recovery protein